jgi:hypothetical protein
MIFVRRWLKMSAHLPSSNHTTWLVHVRNTQCSNSNRKPKKRGWSSSERILVDALVGVEVPYFSTFIPAICKPIYKDQVWTAGNMENLVLVASRGWEAGYRIWDNCKEYILSNCCLLHVTNYHYFLTNKPTKVTILETKGQSPKMYDFNSEETLPLEPARNILNSQPCNLNMYLTIRKQGLLGTQLY